MTIEPEKMVADTSLHMFGPPAQLPYDSSVIFPRSYTRTVLVRIDNPTPGSLAGSIRSVPSGYNDTQILQEFINSPNWPTLPIGTFPPPQSVFDFDIGPT